MPEMHGRCEHEVVDDDANEWMAAALDPDGCLE
jgi:hypothetical protein